MTDPAAAARAVLEAGEERDSLAALPGFSLVQWKAGRAVLRGGRGPDSFFVKRFSRSRFAEGRAEATAYRMLAVTGVPAAALLAAVEEGRSLALVLSDAGPGLDDVVALEGHFPAKLRARFSRAARTVRALHGAGFAFPDLLARHLRVGADGEVRIIDVARLEGPGRLLARGRARDLGVLMGTLPRLAVPERARLRFLRECLGTLDRKARRFVAGGVAKEAARVRRLSRHRHSALEIAPGERDRLLAEYQNMIHFHSWMEGEPGVRLRLLPDRENRRFEAGGRTYFLKRHFHGSRAGMEELEGTLAFRRGGVPAALPAAVGEDVEAGSFWCAAAAPGEPLDDLLAGGGVPVPARRELAGILGRHAAALRRAGLFHRDLYLNHWIGRWSAGAGWELALIDLQRWGRVGLRKERWFVKDAAALWHSARRTPFTRTDGVRFLRAYFRIPRLDRRAKSFARAVLRKAATMAAHRPRTAT